MSYSQWVVSKYAPETGERFELLYAPRERESESFYKVRSKRGDILYLYLPKSDYIPCHPPEQWEDVPIDGVIRIVENGRSIFSKVDGLYYWCNRDEQFIIRDGALVLQRKVRV